MACCAVTGTVTGSGSGAGLRPGAAIFVLDLCLGPFQDPPEMVTSSLPAVSESVQNAEHFPSAHLSTQQEAVVCLCRHVYTPALMFW